MGKWILVRKACLMEDEGRDHIVSSHPTKEEALQARDRYTENDTGYFKNADMAVVAVE